MRLYLFGDWIFFLFVAPQLAIANPKQISLSERVAKLTSWEQETKRYRRYEERKYTDQVRCNVNNKGAQKIHPGTGCPCRRQQGPDMYSPTEESAFEMLCNR